MNYEHSHDEPIFLDERGNKVSPPPFKREWPLATTKFFRNGVWVEYCSNDVLDSIPKFTACAMGTTAGWVKASSEKHYYEKSGCYRTLYCLRDCPSRVFFRERLTEFQQRSWSGPNVYNYVETMNPELIRKLLLIDTATS
jgi:hypothetical protein